MMEEEKGGLTAVTGFRAAGVNSGIKEEDLDLMLLSCDKGPVPSAGLFTSNTAKGAPVQVSKNNLDSEDKLGAVVVNSGCANAFTGREGIRDARTMAQTTAEQLDIKPEEVGVASTGPIGPHLPIEDVEKGIEEASEKLSNSWDAGSEAAEAMTTTDTKIKESAVSVEMEDGSEVTVGGAAKGAGMIHPDLHATMIGILITDASITPAGLRFHLKEAVNRSFNMTTVDRETSTNDTVFAMANGIADNDKITKKDPSERFQRALNKVTEDLTKMIAKDGEGSEHLIEVKVEGASTKEDARKSARTVAGSNLVKASISGKDPNYGRIVAALGYSGVDFAPSRLSISLIGGDNEAPLVLKGETLPNDSMDEANRVLDMDEIQIYIDLDNGSESATAWGCDLTEEYVEINSGYY